MTQKRESGISLKQKSAESRALGLLDICRMNFY